VSEVDVDALTTTAIGSEADRTLLRRMLVFARPHIGALSVTFGLLILNIGLGIAKPMIIRGVIDGPLETARQTRGTPEFDPAALTGDVTGYALMFLGVAALLALNLVLLEWLMNRTGQRVVFSIRNCVFHHILRLPVAWFDRHNVGWVVTRSTSDIDSLSELFTTGVATIAKDLLSIIVVIGVLIWISPQLAMVALVMLPVMIFVTFRFRLKARMAYRATRKSLSRLNGFLQERLSGLDVVHLFRREEDSADRFGSLNEDYYKDNMVTVWHFSMFFPTVDTLSQVVKMGTLTWATWLIVQGDISLGSFVMFWFLLDFVFEPIRELAERYNVLQAAMAAGERILGILDAPTEEGRIPIAQTIATVERESREDNAPDPTVLRFRSVSGAGVGSGSGSGSGSTAAAATATATATSTATATATATTAATASATALPADDTPAVEFDGVSFAYPVGDDVLRNVSFRIGRGQKVAVVGHTGAGKSTLVNLLCRFHETDRGTVRLGGRDVRTLPHQDLRRRIAIVQQDVFLFSQSIAANIRMGDETLNDQRIADCAEAVNANRFIDTLPDRYETDLLERGSNISSGQRQLVAFARALAADPEILVLDEATSSVDSETEHWIEEATATLLEGRTSLVIAHRLSTVVRADMILVMHKGEVHEVGTHEELLAAKGLYHRLYHLHLAATS
jgi:ATP-binding cassette subfamily B multidrug efflux pump